MIRLIDLDTRPPSSLFLTIQDVSLNGTGSTVDGLTVTLSDVNLFTTGLYGCEASADPSFHTELVRRHLTILGTYCKSSSSLSLSICLVLQRARAALYELLIITAIVEVALVLLDGGAVLEEIVKHY